MSSTPWFKFYPGDYLADTRRLTRSQHGAYLLLIIDYFASGKAPPNDDEILARLTLCESQSEWIAIRKAISQYFDITDVWTNSRCEKELNARTSEHNKKSEAGKKGNEIKWGQSQSESQNTDSANRNSVAIPDVRSQRLDVRSKKSESIKNKDTHLSMLLNVGVEKQIAKDWLSIRKIKRLPLTETAFDAISKKILGAGLTMNAGIKICVEQGWAGFSADWLSSVPELKVSGPFVHWFDTEEATYERARKEGVSTEGVDLGTLRVRVNDVIQSKKQQRA